jgi:hypothetical protein
MIIIPIFLIVGGYVIVSVVLLFFPTLLHKPHQFPKAPQLEEAVYGSKILKIAHRGGARIKA